MAWHVMPDYDSYDAAREQFAWSFPDEYNPAVDCLRKHEEPDPADRLALVDAATDEQYTFADLDRASGRLATALAGLGIGTGHRVGVVGPQRPETPISHLALWKLGAVTVPLTTLFGRDALAFRLDDAGATAVLADPVVRDDLAAATAECPSLEAVVEFESRPWYVGEPEPAEDVTFDCERYSSESLVADAGAEFEPVEATPTTETAIMYTSGSTGPPKGVRHGHALWLGRAAAAYNFFEGGLGAGTVTWTPADWAWGSALGGLLLGSWHYGATVVAAPMQGFDPAAAFDLCADHDVSHALAPPTALRMLMNEGPEAYDLALDVVATAGEPLTPEILEWAAGEFDDLTINEYYGQTELNLVVANARRWFPVRPGSMGKPLPGYDVTILDPDTGEQLPPGEVGEIAVRPHDERVFFTEYLNRPEATAEKTDGEWYLTDDHGYRDEDGYLWFEARADDVIITSGYRVGPLEVEQVLLDHSAVEQVGVVGVPDDTRGEIIKAFVEPTPDADPGDDLRRALRERARDRLATYEYPREIAFVDALPMTASGKVRRVELREREHSGGE